MDAILNTDEVPAHFAGPVCLMQGKISTETFTLIIHIDLIKLKTFAADNLQFLQLYGETSPFTLFCNKSLL